MATPASLSAGKSLENPGPQYVSAWPVLDWWRTLGDTQLDELIQEALQGNPDLAAAEARARQAAAVATAVDASRSPSIGAKASVQDIHVPGTVLSSLGPAHDLSITTWMASLNGSYKADFWGGERAAWEAALGEQRASEVDAQAARLALSAELVRAYARLAYAWQAHDLMEKDVERAAHLLELTAQRVNAGIDGSAQQRQAEASVAAARQQLAQSAHVIESARIALAILVGKGPDRAAAIARPAALKPLALAVPENLPAELLGRRPDIVAARWRVEAAQRKIDAAKADFYPSFNLSAAFGLVSLRSEDLLSLRSRYHTVTPAVSLPIFDAGRLRAGLSGRNAEYDIAVARYNKTLVSAFNEVALHMQATQALTAQESAQRQAAGAAREAWDLSMQRYHRGLSSHIETLVAEQSLLAKETTLALIHAQQIDHAIQLIHTLGGGYAGGSPPDAISSATR